MHNRKKSPSLLNSISEITMFLIIYYELCFKGDDKQAREEIDSDPATAMMFRVFKTFIYPLNIALV